MLAGRGGVAYTILPTCFPLGCPVRIPHQGVTLLYMPPIITCFVKMDKRCNQVRQPPPTPGSGTLWVTGGALAGPTCLLPVPMDGVPYPQPLTGHEPRYVPWGAPRVKPLGQPPGLVPPWVVVLRSQLYPALLLPLKQGRYTVTMGGPLTARVRFHANVPPSGLEVRPRAVAFPAPMAPIPPAPPPLPLRMHGGSLPLPASFPPWVLPPPCTALWALLPAASRPLLCSAPCCRLPDSTLWHGRLAWCLLVGGYRFLFQGGMGRGGSSGVSCPNFLPTQPSCSEQ